LLAATPFGELPNAQLDELASALEAESFAAHATVIREGDIGDRLYLIVEGVVEVTVAGPRGAVPLATLGPGELFGELALLSPSARRQATVTTRGPLRALSLRAATFHRSLNAHPGARAAFVSAREALGVAEFLKVTASPFAALDARARRQLAARLERRRVPAGTTFVRQGEPGDCCYLIRSGAVEVTRTTEGEERKLATLGPGALFGEAALLTEAPRNATIRALEFCDLLLLHRSDLIEAAESRRELSSRLLELLQLRSQPRQVPGVVAMRRASRDGDVITVLKHPAGRYFLLSAQGLFIWKLLDGKHTLRDLTLAYVSEFKAFAPQAIAELIANLGAAGFVTGAHLRFEVREKEHWLRRATTLARGVLEWQVSVSGLDPRLTRLYRGGVRLLFTRPAQVGLAALAVAGFVAFLRVGARAGVTINDGPVLLLVLLPGQLLATLVHEAGHAFTTKAFGRDVVRAGVGWYWFGPIAFVDTSDMWLAERWPRVAVSLAGPYANVVLAGVAALGAAIISSDFGAAALWQLALASYVSLLFDLNPLLEFDGYYVLMDLLERPNLRQRALAWLRWQLPAAIRQPRALGGHMVELLYAVASLAYIGAAAVFTALLYRLLLQDWLAGLLSRPVATALGWVVATSFVVLVSAGTIGDLRAARAPARSL